MAKVTFCISWTIGHAKSTAVALAEKEQRYHIDCVIVAMAIDLHETVQGDQLMCMAIWPKFSRPDAEGGGGLQRHTV